MSSGALAFCTVVAKNYLARARVLVGSLRRQHPEVRVYVLLVDEPEGCFDPAEEPFIPLFLDDLDLPRPREFRFRYDVVELSTAVRPFLLRALFARGYSRLVYLDPDSRLYSPLDLALQGLEQWNVLLTPHLNGPLLAGQPPGERQILLCGAYNMGFLGVRRGPESDELLRWLSDRLERECLVDPANGLFVDQRWMDLAPGMVEGVHVLRHPGYNVGHWNIRQRQLAGSLDAPLVDGQRLVSFHFSGFRPERPDRLSRYDDEPLAEEPLVSMLAQYRDELLAAGQESCSAWPYTHAGFSDGHRVSPEMRALFREQPPGRFSDPFLVDGEGSFRRWAVTEIQRRRNTQASTPLSGESTVTVRPEDLSPIARRILAAREDVRRAYQTADGRLDWPGLLGWLEHDGVRDYALKPEWCAEWAGEDDTALPRLLAFYDGRPDLQRRFPTAFVEEHDGPVFWSWIEAHADEAGLDAADLGRLRRLMGARPTARIREIYAIRADVMQAYPAALGWPPDPGFVGWLFYSGQREHGLSADEARWFVRSQEQHVCLRVHQAYAARREWQDAHPRGLTALGRPRFLAWLKTTGAVELGPDPERVARLCPAEMLTPLTELRRLHASDPELQRRFPGAFRQVGQAEGLLAWLREQGAGPEGPDPGWVESVERGMGSLGLLGHGVTIVGHTEGESGAVELARATARALEAAEYPFTTMSLDHPAAWREGSAEWRAAALFPFSLIHLTPAALGALRQRSDLERLPGRHRIAYWCWEPEEMPPDWKDAFALFDEVWTCSRYAASVLAASAPVPVQVVWPVVEEPAGPLRGGREARQSAELTFLFLYDPSRESERQNPAGLVRAFREAFRPDDRVRLLIRVASGGSLREHLGRLEEAAAGLRVTLQDGPLSRSEVFGLLGACDAYVSLHRAEGFGLTLAEAMVLGKPVIATYYSGNVDFMTPWNCFPVPYDLVETPAASCPHADGAVWAEPDVAAAAHLMRLVYEGPRVAAEVAGRGQADVRRLLSPRACGQRLQARFRAIRRNDVVDGR